jgi:abortive infection bacteriophage resistance protein
MTEKTFKTIDEQLEILSQRGLSITNIEEAKEFLLRNNYYRISGYSLTLRKEDIFSKRASFKNIIDIYNFDHELRHIILQHIETIEVQVKSVYVYEFTKCHGPIGYLDSSLFTDSTRHHEIISKSTKQVKQRLHHEAYLKHFVTDLKQDIPLWAYIDLLTISDISFLYSITQDTIQTAVARTFGLTMVKGSSILSSYLHSLTIIRNLCAHGSRIYNRLFEQKPSLNSKEKQLLIKNEKGEIDNAHFYGFVLIMRRLLPHNHFYDLKKSIVGLSKKYPFVRMSYYGFRDDWKQEL